MILLAADEHADADHEMKTAIFAAAGFKLPPRKPVVIDVEQNRATIAQRLKMFAKEHNANMRAKKRRSSQLTAARAKLGPQAP